MEMLITSRETTVHIYTTANKNGNDYTDIGGYVVKRVSTLLSTTVYHEENYDHGQFPV